MIGPQDPRERPLAVTPDMLAAPPTLDFEQGMSLAPPFSILMILLLIGTFVWQLGLGALDSAEQLIGAGALERERVLAGEWWRLASATFLHGGFDHLLGNCIVLYIVGMACEHAFGVRGMGVIYALAGLGGSALSVALQPGPSVGASGAIFGVSGAVTAVLYRYRATFRVRDNRVGAVLLAWAMYQITIGLMSPYIDNLAHVGGLVGGAAVGWAMRPSLLDKLPRSVRQPITPT